MLKTVKLGDLEMAVDDRGSGPPVVLVHGFPLDHSMWQSQLDALAVNHRLITPDQRGFGKSRPAPTELSMAQLADDLASLLDALQITEKVVYCGLSMGGYVGWQFWRRYAERLSGMIMCDTRAISDSPDAAADRRRVAEMVRQNQSGRVVAEAMIFKLFGAQFRNEHPEIVEQTFRVMESTPPETVAAALCGIAERVDATAWLAEIQIPVLVIVGEDDQISKADEMREFAAAIPGAEFCEIPSAGHMAPLERPEMVNERISSFLARYGTS